jgi:membrane protease YdiL (CAAX protease family)
VTLEPLVPSGNAPDAWRPRNAAALVLGVTLLNLLVGRIVRALTGSELAPAVVSLGLLVAFVTLYVVQLGTVASVVHHAGGRVRQALGLHVPPAPAAWLAVAVLAALAARAFATAYAGFMISVGWRLQGWDSDPTRFFPTGVFGSLVLVFVIVVAAPIAEETIFRGVLLPSLSEWLGEGWGIVVTSAVFAALHLNLFSFVPVFVVAWVLGLLYRRSGSLWVSIAGHASFNALGILAVLLLRGTRGM